MHLLIQSSLRLFFLAYSILIFTSPLSHSGEIPLHDESVVKFATLEQGRQILQARDRFVTAQSPFDRQARLKTDRQVSVDEYLRFVSAHVRPWEESEKKAISNIMIRLGKKLAPWKLKFPAEVLLVKTTGEEEGDAAYCRKNAIVLPLSKVALPGKNLERLLTHELFHILSSHNSELRRKLYATIGFQPCTEITLPNELAHRKITNPDGPRIDYYIELTEGDRVVKVVPVLFSKTENYDTKRGGSFFQYLQFRLLAVEQKGSSWIAMEKDGRPILLNPSTSKSFHQQIGANTRYIIHPDEVLADNFVYLIQQKQDLPTPRIQEDLKSLLRR